MKNLFILLTAVFSISTSTSFAKTVCKVKNYKQAIKCIKKDALKRYQTGEMPHSVGVTKKVKGKNIFKEITGKKPTKKYVGVVQVHYDEDQMLYYQIGKGRKVSPELVFEENIVDFGWDKNKEFTTEEMALYISNIKDFHGRNE
ncbi:hypothetical protein N9N67_04915 [Bacteriovoracaceae bacterium]|nr:hypothetical protein [Bacteriovoracaceae bacterium]